MNEKEKFGWNCIESLTKDEIILFLKTRWYRPPSQQDINFFKWETTSNKLQKEMDEYLSNNNAVSIAKEINTLQEKIKTEKNNNIKIKLQIKQLKLYKEIEVDHEKWDKIEAKQRKNDAFYESVVKPGYASGQ